MNSLAEATTAYKHVRIDTSGTPIIAGTNVKVVELVTAHAAYGWSPEELHFHHPYLSMGQIHSALAYYWDHKGQLDADIDRRGRDEEEGLSMISRPGGITVLCITLIIIGIFGICGGLFGVANQVSGDARLRASFEMQATTWERLGVDPIKVQELNEQADNEATAKMQALRPVSWLAISLGLAISAMLIYGAIRAWRPDPGAPVLLRRILIAAIVLGVIDTAFNSYVGLQMVKFGQNYTQQLADILKASNDGQLTDRAIIFAEASFRKAGPILMASQAIATFLDLFEVFIFVIGLWYLRKPNAVAYFSPPPAPASPRSLPAGSSSAPAGR